MLVLDKIEKSFQNKKVVKGISSDFREGQCYLLLGENGAGKSTLFQCIAGDVVMDHGAIHIARHDEPSHAIALQYQFFASFPFLKVREVIQLFSQLLQEPAQVEELYEILAIAEFEKTLVKNTSGGQRKALSIYLTFLINKPVVLLDEPFADLDLLKKKQLAHFLHKQVREKMKCLVIISHEIAGFEALFDTVFIMKDGQFIEQGSPSALAEKYKKATFPGLEGVYFELTGQLLGGRMQ